MSVGLSDAGLEIKRLPEIVKDVEEGLKSIYGNDLIFDPSSPQAQLSGILCEDYAILYEMALSVYTGLNPNNSTGQMLDRVNSIRGVTRKAATSSKVDLVFTGLAGAAVPVGTLVTSPNESDISWRVVELGTVGSTVKAECTQTGPIPGVKDTLVEIKTPVINLTGVNNPDDASLGSDTETDAQLRVRGNQSVAAPAQAIIDGMVAGLLAVDGVTGVKVYENTTNVYDSNTGTSEKSMRAIVENGSDSDIADVIFLRKSLGCGMDGNVTVVKVDSQGVSHDIRFDRPITKDIFVDVQITTLTGWIAGTEEQIKQAVVDYANGEHDTCVDFNGYGIGDDVHSSDLYVPLIANRTYRVDAILVGDVAPAFTFVDVEADRLSNWDTANITVTIA